MTLHMTTRLAAFALAAATLQATPAYAHACSTYPRPPRLNGDGTATGKATFQCFVEPGTISVEVCLEVLSVPGLWTTHGCTTNSTSTSWTVAGESTANVCAIPATVLMRTTALGVAGDGDSDFRRSDPTPVACRLPLR